MTGVSHCAEWALRDYGPGDRLVGSPKGIRRVGQRAAVGPSEQQLGGVFAQVHPTLNQKGHGEVCGEPPSSCLC